MSRLHIRIFGLIVLMLFRLDIASAQNLAASDVCSVFVVKPPDNHGGTIYVKKHSEGSNYRRAGYLAVGSFVQLISDSSVRISHKRGAQKEVYSEFRAANGTTGFIKKDSVTSLSALIKAENVDDNSTINVQCDEIKGIIIPTDADRPVQIFYKPENSNVRANSLAFSRSAFKLVIVKNTTVQLEAEDGTSYYKVLFAQQETDPQRAIWKEGYLRLLDEDLPSSSGTFRIAYLPETVIFDSPVQEVNCGNLLECTKSSLSRLFDSISEDDLSRMAQKLSGKSCGTEDKISLSVEVNVGISRKFFSFQGEGSRTLIMPDSKKYVVRTYTGVSPKNGKAELFMVIDCDGSNPISLHKLSVKIEDRPESEILLDAKTILKYVKDGAVAANKFGVGSRYKDKIFIIPYEIDKGSYFRTFEKLRRFLEGRIGSEKETVTGIERERIMTLLINVMSGWQGPFDSPPAQ